MVNMDKMTSDERFGIFKEACSLMDREEYYQAYLKLGELSDYCLQMSAKIEGEKFYQMLLDAGFYGAPGISKKPRYITS